MGKQVDDFNKAKYAMMDHYDRNYPDSTDEERNAYIKGLVDMTEYLNGKIGRAHV